MLLLCIIALAAASSAVLRDVQCKYINAGVIACESTHAIEIGSLNDAVIEIFAAQKGAAIASCVAVLMLTALVVWIGEKIDRHTDAVIAKMDAQQGRTTPVEARPRR